MKKNRNNIIFKLSAFLAVIAISLYIIPIKNVSADTDQPPISKEPLTGKTAKEITDEMGLGWNLGNTFDATGGNKSNIYSQETSWGNPQVTQKLIQAVHDRGFNTIRIPVTWANQIDRNDNYSINPAFLARVQEVVNYAYELDMYIILNVHHESWVNIYSLDTKYEQVGEELEAVWTQLADYFAEYDQHLIFEGMNEPRKAGSDVEWTGNEEAYRSVNYLNQIFTYTVRSSEKGYNKERCLMIPGYAASSNPTILDSICIPTYEGKAVNNLIISVHCYSPYNFCLTDNQVDFNPNNAQHTADIDSLFAKLERRFLFRDIPVVIGETSATDKNNTEARENWAEYMGKKSREYGIPIILWDNGSNTHSGGESHAWINRSKCEWNYPTVLDKLFSSTETVEWGSRTAEERTEYEANQANAAKPASTSFKVGGRTFDSRESINTLKGLKLLGWYTSMDFKEGTEYSGDYSNVTLYGKLAWEKDSVAMAMEHEDTDLVTPTPTPSPTPEPTATPVPTDTPSPEPTIEPQEVPDEAVENAAEKTVGFNVLPIIIIGIVLLLGGAGLLVFNKTKKK